MSNIGSISSRMGACFTSACNSVGNFAGRVVCQLKNAGKAFCNLMSSLWEKIVTFFEENTPTDEEFRKGAKSAKRYVSDLGRKVGRSFSDARRTPTTLTRIERGASDFARFFKRGVDDLKEKIAGT